jgi:aspartate carbamoyltransferase catalytic subunit
MRHPTQGAADVAAQAFELSGRSIPIINAGDGGGEHPTQVKHFRAKRIFFFIFLNFRI